MLSKDHFSNILNEPAGKVASQVLTWVVPQIIACYDDERIDINRTLTRIINGVFHHPAHRDYGDDGAVDGRRWMFGVVEQWWGAKDEQERQVLRQQLSRDGVEQGRNHKPGVVDSGHGCGKPLGMPTAKTASSSGAIGGLTGGLVGGGVLGEIGSAFQGESQYDSGYAAGGGTGGGSGAGKFVESAVGGGALGTVAGLAAGAIGGDLLGDAFSGSRGRKASQASQNYEEDGSFTQSYTETGYTTEQSAYPGAAAPRYGQAEYSQTSFVDGGQRQQYQRYEQEESQYDRFGGGGGGGAFAEQITQESHPTYGGGYEQTTETRYERPTGEWQSEVRVEGRETVSSEAYSDVRRYSGRAPGGYEEESFRRDENRRDSSSSSSDNDRQGGGGRPFIAEESSTYETSGGGYEYQSEQRRTDEYGGGGGEYREEESGRYEDRSGGYEEERYEERRGSGDGYGDDNGYGEERRY